MPGYRACPPSTPLLPPSPPIPPCTHPYPLAPTRTPLHLPSPPTHPSPKAGIKLFLHCGVCLLSIIALLLLDAALVTWIYLGKNKEWVGFRRGSLTCHLM